jgi:hypothetical protein
MAAQRPEGDQRARGLLLEDDVVEVVITSAAAELFRDVDAHRTDLAELVVQITRHVSLSLPAYVVGPHLLVDEVAYPRPERRVLLGEDRPSHSLSSRRHRFARHKFVSPPGL